jgi:hypothetical protein
MKKPSGMVLQHDAAGKVTRNFDERMPGTMGGKATAAGAAGRSKKPAQFNPASKRGHSVRSEESGRWRLLAYENVDSSLRSDDQPKIQPTH